MITRVVHNLFYTTQYTLHIHITHNTQGGQKTSFQPKKIPIFDFSELEMTQNA